MPEAGGDEDIAYADAMLAHVRSFLKAQRELMEAMRRLPGAGFRDGPQAVADAAEAMLQCGLEARGLTAPPRMEAAHAMHLEALQEYAVAVRLIVADMLSLQRAHGMAERLRLGPALERDLETLAEELEGSDVESEHAIAHLERAGQLSVQATRIRAAVLLAG